jgi:hypothetical protein
MAARNAGRFADGGGYLAFAGDGTVKRVNYPSS